MFEHIERLVGQCGREFQHQCRECSVAPQRLKLRQVLHGTLAALAGEFKPMILVNPRSNYSVEIFVPGLPPTGAWILLAKSRKTL
jgi:hypothetical protein